MQPYRFYYKQMFTTKVKLISFGYNFLSLLNVTIFVILKVKFCIIEQILTHLNQNLNNYNKFCTNWEFFCIESQPNFCTLALKFV